VKLAKAATWSCRQLHAAAGKAHQIGTHEEPEEVNTLLQRESANSVFGSMSLQMYLHLTACFQVSNP
jgi:hypothetical protein